jgi:hypothetical protein
MRNRADSWRDLARQAQAIADRFSDPNSRRMMTEIAERYEALAVAEEQLAVTELSAAAANE